MTVRGQRCLHGMLGSFLVVPAGHDVVSTICYGTGGDRMDGEQRWEEEEEEEDGGRRRMGRCSCARSPPG